VTSRHTNPPKAGMVHPERSSLGGKYQLMATLGQGGMADVYLAVARGPLGFNKVVVLKRLRAHVHDEAQALQMFLDEARLAARLNHPNIVDTYDIGCEAGSYFIAMEYLDGQPLSRVLKATRRSEVNPTLWVHIVAEALHGLHHAHELRDYDGKPLRIVHRDVSPHNIFVTYDAEVKVVDFGIAKAASNLSQTEAGLLKGKIGFMAPEQALEEEVDHRADIYSMGVVLWEALAGKKMLEGTVAVAFGKLTKADAVRLLEVKPDVDPRLASIVDRALKKNPSDRFATAAEMREALMDYLRSVPSAATKADIARLMTTFFAGQRAAVQREIEKHLTSTAKPPSHGPFWDSTKVLAAVQTSASGLSPTPSKQTPAERAEGVTSITGTGSLTHAASAASVPGPAVSSPRDSRTKLIAVLLATAAAAVSVVFALRATHQVPAVTIVRAPNQISVTIESDPTDAFLTWKGQTMGRTPLTLQLPSGVQNMVLSKQGFATEPITLDLNDAVGPTSRVVTLKAETEIAIAPTLAVPGGASPAGASHRSIPLAPSKSPRGSHVEKPSEPSHPGAPDPANAPASPASPPLDKAPPVPAAIAPPPAAPEPPPAPAAPAPGTMDPKGVSATIRAHQGEIQACLDRARMDRADLHGRLTIQARISPTGQVLSTSATNNIEGGARLQSCVTSAFQNWTFPPPAGGVEGTVSKTFVFE
jgi:serine/threonine protein kinase